MTRIEVLFPEFCSLFADSSNVRYLEKCLPDAEFVYTSYMDEPLFVKETPDLIYMGAMTESAQEKIIKKLMPYRERIASLIAADVPMLFTNNAVEIFGPVLAAQAFGRKDFSVSFSCMNMISGIVRSCSYAVLAILHSMSNGYSAPYTVFGIIAVIGGCMIFAVKEKKEEETDKDTVAAC